MADFVTVTLLRHGITEANLEKRYVGWTDVPLAEEARQMLEKRPLLETHFDYCVTSDLLRARQTATIFCPTLDIVETPAFREMNFGQWEMKTYEELKENVAYRQWIDAPESVRPPNGESFAEMTTRVDEGFRKLRQETVQCGSKNILLVAHGGILRYLLTQVTEETKHFFEWQVPHNQAIRLLWKQEDWESDGKCISLQVVPLTEKGHG